MARDNPKPAFVALAVPSSEIADRYTAHRAKADPDCPICKGANLLILDALQVDAARQRWQFDDRLDAGANDCPCSHPSQRIAQP